ncbi:hypothetical protein MMC2321_00738 [Chitinophaga sp. MM2321]
MTAVIRTFFCTAIKSLGTKLDNVGIHKKTRTCAALSARMSSEALNISDEQILFRKFGR